MRVFKTRGGWTAIVLGLACWTTWPTPDSFAQSTPPSAVEEASDADSEAADIQELRRDMRCLALLGRACKHDLIGALASYGYWKDLSLSDEQADAILKLDALVKETRTMSRATEAEHPAEDLAFYRDYLERGQARRRAALRAAERMVTQGLLNPPQEAMVYQRLLSRRRPYSAARNENIQDLLGVTESQRRELARMINEAGSHEERNAAVESVLTPGQRQRWGKLAAKRPVPATPTALPSLDSSAEKSAREDVLNRSPYFRAIIERADELGLSAQQREALEELLAITARGLIWRVELNGEVAETPEGGGDEQTGPIAQRQTAFLSSAAQFALLGVLTERQARQVRAMIFGC